MKKIYKYELTENNFYTMGDCKMKLPRGAKLRYVGTQEGYKVGLGKYNYMCLWAEIDTENAPVDRMIFIVGTGHTIPMTDIAVYIGTIQINGFVWHVYDAGEQE